MRTKFKPNYLVHDPKPKRLSAEAKQLRFNVFITCLLVQVPGLRHVISQAASGYIDPASGHMQAQGQAQVYHDQHHMHPQVGQLSRG